MCDTSSNHDNVLFEMLKECKTLPNFLAEVFGFLQRRTDFYIVANEPNAAVGLPEGLAEKLVRHTFYKCKPQPTEAVYNDIDIPTATEETVVTNSEEMNEVTSTTDDLYISETKPHDTFSKSEFYNGAVHDNYCWSQTILEVNIVVLVPENVTKKDLDVTITPNQISVKLNDGTYLLDGDLCQKCKANDMIWSLDGRKVEIHLDKCQDVWWNCLIKSEPEMDISKIDCTRPYEDLPEEAQAKIEELQWNQERKRLGLPTSEEIIVQEKLKKAWNAEGSPFTGSFDPSVVSFS
ncbi:nudC domain-containing protein 3 [Anoplophora glabripennis]|uniref:nudC domain-containing protein 3 n=1 Tax=Anoplophora glabripennis TaxID=217634 RepID=UPI0008735C5F|nr:nudC domain-containing protein 3 [Anoplophora glabripennis]